MAIALVIPAYEPADCLVAALEALSRSSAFAALIVVDDGSAAECNAVFAEAARVPGVCVVRHAVNQGKGAALKTGFAYAMREVPDLAGIITADADGQHLSEDILNVAERLKGSPASLVLGVRTFTGDVPWRSRLGNVLTRSIVSLLIGQKLTDTQTGLRGIPISLVPALLALTSNAYEFELDMLLTARRRACSIEQVPIQTVYEPGNPSSHFHPVLDSMKVYFVLLRFCSVSLASSQSSRWRTGVTALTLVTLISVAAYGFAAIPIFSQQIWLPDGLERARSFLLVFVIACVPMLVLARNYFRPAVIVLALAATAFAVGAWAPLAVLLFCFSAAVIGKLLLHREPTKPDEPLLALLLGTAIWIAIEELLVRLPWNYPWVYAVLLLLPVMLARHTAWETIKSAALLFRPLALGGLGERAAAFTLTLILTAHWLMVLKPEVSEDGLAMHLAIADGVAWKHRFAFDLAHNIWAVMPMGGDWCFTLVYLLGGEFAARLLNFGFLLILTALLFLACRRFLSRGAALWIAALFASTPLVQLVTGSLFIENILAAILFGGMAALWRFEESGSPRYLFAAALLFGTALHIKLGSLGFLIPGLALLGLQIHRRWQTLGSRRVLLVAQTAVIVIAAGAPPYLIAAVATRDPVFPFLRSVFPSPTIAPGVVIAESRFHEPLRASTLFDLTFHTTRYFEGQDGSFGLQYLLLLPAALMLIRCRNYVAWSATVVALCGSIAILLSQPNVRYLYPALPLFHLTIAGLLAGFGANPLVLRGLIVSVFAGTIGVDLVLFPSSSWYHKSFYSAPLFTAAGRYMYLQSTEPRRFLIDDLNRRHPGETVFLANSSLITGIRAPVFREHWHDPSTKLLLDGTLSADEVLEYMRRWNVQRFILPSRQEEILYKPVRDFAAMCVEPEWRIGLYFSGRLNTVCTQKLAARRGLSESGRVYDDLSPDVELTGKWVRGQKFLLASGETVSYSDTPGDTIRFAFEGTQITYAYTAAPNRGIARVYLDRKMRGEVDLFRPETEWQAKAQFSDLSAGKHEIEIEVTGRKDAGSGGYYVDLDAFVVR